MYTFWLYNQSILSYDYHMSCCNHFSFKFNKIWFSIYTLNFLIKLILIYVLILNRVLVSFLQPGWGRHMCCGRHRKSASPLLALPLVNLVWPHVKALPLHTLWFWIDWILIPRAHWHAAHTFLTVLDDQRELWWSPCMFGVHGGLSPSGMGFYRVGVYNFAVHENFSHMLYEGHQRNKL